MTLKYPPDYHNIPFSSTVSSYQENWLFAKMVWWEEVLVINVSVISKSYWSECTLNQILFTLLEAADHQHRWQDRNEAFGIGDERSTKGWDLGSLPWDQGSQISSFFRDQWSGCTISVGSGTRIAHDLESRIRNMCTKMGSALTKHTSLPPCR